MTDTLNRAIEALAAQGLPADVLSTIEIAAVPGIVDGSLSMTVGYVSDDRRKVVAQTLGEGERIVETVSDRETLGGFLGLALRAIPKASRPEMPAWIADSVAAMRASRDMRRASSLSLGAANVAADMPVAG